MNPLTARVKPRASNLIITKPFVLWTQGYKDETTSATGISSTEAHFLTGGAGGDIYGRTSNVCCMISLPLETNHSWTIMMIKAPLINLGKQIPSKFLHTGCPLWLHSKASCISLVADKVQDKKKVIGEDKIGIGGRSSAGFYSYLSTCSNVCSHIIHGTHQVESALCHTNHSTKLWNAASANEYILPHYVYMLPYHTHTCTCNSHQPTTSPFTKIGL